MKVLRKISTRVKFCNSRKLRYSFIFVFLTVICYFAEITLRELLWTSKADQAGLKQTTTTTLVKSQTGPSGIIKQVAKNDNNNNNNNINSVSEQRVSECPHLRRPLESKINRRNTYWQAHEDAQNKEDIVVYSAFYDDRTIVDRTPWIRILGIRRTSSRPLWCYLWYPQIEVPVVTRTVIIAADDRIHRVKGGRHYGHHQISCTLKRNDSTPPTHVSLATRYCNSSTIFLPVQRPPRSEKDRRHEFSVCLKVYFGFVSPEWITEWIEAHSMFGVTKIDVYNGSLDARMDSVFNYYRKKGTVEMHQMGSAVDDRSAEGTSLGIAASYNDCLLRNMYSSIFLVVVDLDEIIVPRVQNTYKKMLLAVDKSLNRKTSFHTYSFRNAYFLQSFPEDKKQPKHLKTLRLRHRSPPSEFLKTTKSPPPSDYLETTKSFVEPGQCQSLSSNYCFVRFTKNEPASINVDASLALSHHYRLKCSGNKTTCGGYDKSKVQDDVMLKYTTDLIKRVSKVRKDIGLR